MSDLQVTNVFSDGDTVSATNFNTNYSDIVTYINDRNSAAVTWDAMNATSTSNIPLTANNSTGTQDVVQMTDNGTNVFTVNDGGYINFQLQDFAYTRKSGGVEIYGTGPSKIINWSAQSQTQSNMDSTGKFTADASGKYFLSANIDWLPSSGAQQMVLYIYVNGVSVSKRTGTHPALVTSTWQISDIVNLSVNDYVEVYGSVAAGNVTVVDQKGTNFYVMKLS